MDISLFSNDNFDTKAWVNDVLKVAETQEKKDNNYTMALVMKLQLYVQQVNNALENTSQNVLASLPKIVHDSKLLQQEAMILKDKMEQVKGEIIKIEEDTRKSINTIEKLDIMKNSLTLAKQGLHESDNWTILVNDLEEIFDSKNIEAISAKILGMQNSLKLLINVADYEDRKLQLEGLKNRLEAIASPTIVQAFTTYNTEKSLAFVRIFSSIGRQTELMKYYKNCQRDILVKMWRKQLEHEQDESVIHWINNYYEYLLSNWHSQTKWINQVFAGESPTDILIAIYIDVLSSLDPSLNQCIDATLKQTSDKLTFLQDIKETTKQFCEKMLNIIEQNPTAKVDNAKILDFLKAIYKHLVVYICKYAAYEQANLMKNLNNIHCMKDELPETIQALGLSISQAFDYTLEAKGRCELFTENCGFCGLLVALKAFFSNYAGYFRVALRQIDRSKKFEEDWNTFQLCLSLLQYTGEVLLKVQQLEKDLTATVLDYNKKATNIKYSLLLLDSDNLREFQSLIKCVTEDPETWTQFDTSLLHNSNMPDYSFSPQEYITQIGQYLMTLPQHLEPFLFSENPSLACALKFVDQEYAESSDTEGALARMFLVIMARGTCNSFTDKILSICKLSQPASRQLAHDINYLKNVLQDLGILLSDNLQQLSSLLKIPADQYQTQSLGYTAKYVAAVRQIRNIASN
ncbi:conserved oligomeric Golgi complex subunit 7 isoform X2 [Rhynchophorus ferrugineus]|uniref:conserved oligomeric Golgi complex subunit 7 isoform X2 n=1 Tax=Rhynchophorus ferrugineus TaxID=354439 RepID=UPI003FCEBA87